MPQPPPAVVASDGPAYPLLPTAFSAEGGTAFNSGALPLDDAQATQPQPRLVPPLDLVNAFTVRRAAIQLPYTRYASRCKRLDLASASKFSSSMISIPLLASLFSATPAQPRRLSGSPPCCQLSSPPR